MVICPVLKGEFIPLVANVIVVTVAGDTDQPSLYVVHLSSSGEVKLKNFGFDIIFNFNKKRSSSFLNSNLKMCNTGLINRYCCLHIDLIVARLKIYAL